LPFGWIGSPPCANRLMGIRRLAKILYPELFPADLRAETQRFYGLFYHQEPTDEQCDELLVAPTPP
jgi:iron complex transport system substrate-binding protein